MDLLARYHATGADLPFQDRRARLGGSSVFQVVPRLNQYWHPWLLGGRATGTAVLGDRTWHLAGTLEVRVARRGREVWRGTSYLAGLEHGGLARAEAELARRGGDASPQV